MQCYSFDSKFHLKKQIKKEFAHLQREAGSTCLFERYLDINNIDHDLLVYGNSLRQQLDIPLADFDADQSKFYKFVMPKPINKGVQDREY